MAILTSKKLKLVVISLLALTTLVIFGTKLKDFKMQSTQEKSKKITAVLSGRLSLPLDPLNISTISNYHLHSNLWGTLLSSDPSEALAQIKSVSEDKLTYILALKPDIKFSNGEAIRVEDVLFSINRVLESMDNGHFNPKSVIKNVEALDDSEIKILLNNATPSFEFLLSIPEMGIVPQSSIKAGKLENLDVTSGAYFVESQNLESLALVRNEYFRGVDESSPERVDLKFIDDKTNYAQDALALGANFIEASNTSEVKSFQFLKGKESFEVVSTRPSLSFFAVLNSSNLEAKQRVAISDLISRELAFELDPSSEKRSFEVSPPKTFATLGLNASVTAHRSDKSDLPASVRMLKSTSALSNSIARLLQSEGVEILWTDSKKSEDLDVVVRKQGMNTDFPEIEYHLILLSQWAIFKPTESEKENILEALHEPDLSKRADHVRKVSRALIEDARAVPLLVRSYVHAIDSDVLEVPSFSDYDGEVRFSQMRLRR